ncbi:MAG: hypothetical protein O3A46_08955 [Candidatus Poribacteria bacterium]|nr:hypothetical protein [Candidatus Poribacteria bacterium]
MARDNHRISFDMSHGGGSGFRTLVAFASLTMLFGVIGSASSQGITANDVIARHLDAVGGLKRLDAMKTLRLTGTVTPRQDFQLSLIVSKKRPNKIHVEFAPPGGQSAFGSYDGETAWEINPFDDLPDPVIVVGSQLEEWERTAEFHGPLVHYRESGHKVVYVGVEDGREHLILTFKQGGDMHLFLDAKTHLLVETRMYRALRGGDMTTITQRFRDYRKIEGVQFAFEREETAKNGHREVIKWEKIEVGVELDDALFALPTTRTDR